MLFLLSVLKKGFQIMAHVGHCPDVWLGSIAKISLVYNRAVTGNHEGIFWISGHLHSRQLKIRSKVENGSVEIMLNISELLIHSITEAGLGI
jgi:hypothetical protein